MESQRGPGLIVKAVLAISELTESPCFGLHRNKTEICCHAPDLASSIAGIILSSNDLEFQSRYDLFFELSQSQEIGRQTIEDCIKGKIISVIETNDRNPKKSKEAAPLLFEDNRPQDMEPIPYSEQYEGGKVSVLPYKTGKTNSYSP
ncbi:hypothetical protein V6N11_057602 [Hibiscus sabdariffa]|uniref:Uncharacterized protein n=1 Tax=Hibiscus sabdariffa TaxID=183260 RepID=A0ABR2NHW0_9ROSI